MANFTRVGYGQVEPNQLSAQKTGQIYASLPLDASVQILQNGEFMYYDYSHTTTTSSGAVSTPMVTAEPTVSGQEPMLVFNEIKLYEPFWRTSYKDFAMIRVGDNYVTSDLATAGYGDGALTSGATIDHEDYQAGYRMDGIAPRLFKTNVGDVYTTNMVKTGVQYSVADVLKLEAVSHTYTKADGTTGTYKTLVLAKNPTTAASTMEFAVANVYTMPDGQPGLKIQRIK